MPEGSSKPVVFFTDKLKPWWQGAAGLFLIVSAIAALVLGIGSYAMGSRSNSAIGAVAANAAVADAITRVLAGGKPTIIEFGANSCVSCREMKPILHALAQDTRIAVADVDIIKEHDYISRYQIRLMPTQVFYDTKGQEIGRHMGKISGDEVMQRLGVSSAPTVLTPRATP
jgi:thioredoxin 1